ncbi:MAG TPA: FAD/NAD(P)-binding protein [Solirubrobacteraceae bacterium]|nr:FAD/NAD(P)-binding protein [Solirubrobacteraceae bacterium]
MGRDGADGGPLRLAIVGLGPKGLFALERVLDHAHRTGAPARIDVDVFEPHPAPGAGPVYDPAQPAYLRMNFAADRLDMWWPQTQAVPAGERLSFVAWRRCDAGGVRAGEDPYPPRAEVGRYLAAGLAGLLRHAPPAVCVTLRPVAVEALDRRAGGWRVRAGGGATHDYDEVLVTVGHGLAVDPLGTGRPEHAVAHVGAVFPVGRRLSAQRVPAGAAVAVRGFALTFLDAALALTEGRGGTFDAGEHPYRLRYRPAEAEAGVILPYSRTGRPMLAKPDPRLAAGIPALDAITQEGSARIVALPGGFSLQADLRGILAATAAASLFAAGGGPARRASAVAAAWLAAACDGAPPPSGQSPAAELERSVAIGAGRRTPDLAWALGHTWRSVYPALVRRVGARGLSDRQWPAFRRLAAQLERVSFGPPLVNAAKLLALVDAGRVDLTHVAAGQITSTGAVTSLRSARGARAVDVVVNAVLASPGAGAGLPAQLRASGYARTLPGRRGLDVGADAAAADGLAIIGRATEDSVIGNDTLSRAMHPHADRWAAGVVERAARRTSCAIGAS